MKKRELILVSTAGLQGSCQLKASNHNINEVKE